MEIEGPVPELKPVILVVDDNPEILLNLEITLECNDYSVISAVSGKKAIKILQESKKLPDLIISDIMMPEMDGYEFFETISENSSWNQIPFIFLTAKAAIDDIRLGKMLGVDDYITKPFKDEDLLASISGKLARVKKSFAISQNIEEKLTKLGFTVEPTISDRDMKNISLFWMLWDERLGPVLKGSYSLEEPLTFSMEAVGSQLFHGTVIIYGYGDYSEAQGILLNVKNIDMDSYVFFDMKTDQEVRGGQRQYMIALIAPKISYLETMQLKEVFRKLSTVIKRNEEPDLKIYWNAISEILSKPIWR